MAKEVLDNKKLKKAKKSGEGIYSEEAGNVLKAKTPEEEYIANREAEIKEIKGKIKENKKAIKEVEKKLPSEKEIEERSKEIVEEISIKKLSEILSEEELEIVRKGRGFSELNEIFRERMSDPLKNLINKIFEGIKDLTDEEKVIIAKYLGNKQIIFIDMWQSQCGGGYTCRVGSCYDDFEDKMYMYYGVKNNLYKLGLGEYIKYIGDSCYSLEDSLYERSGEIIKEKLLSDSEKEIKSEFDRLKKDGEKFWEKLESIEERKHAVEKYGLPEKEAVSLYQWSEDLYEVQDEFYDKESHTLVVLHEYSDYNGSGGSEYGTVINIKRGKNTTKQSFKYRDRYDYRNDNPSCEYKKIKSVIVDGNKVEVTVSNGKSTDTYTFHIAYKEDKKSLSSIEKEEFEEYVKVVEEKLIIENTKDQKYNAICNFAMRKIPGAFDGMGYDAELYYDKAKVIYENIIPEKGEAHFTILMQKDASSLSGRQFGLIKYILNSEGVKKIDEYFYYEGDQMEGNVDKEKMEEFTNR